MTKNIIIACSVLAFAQFVSGHSLGQSLEKQINGYFIDVGYSARDKIYTGDATRFDFNLWTENKADLADFDHVWVRISPADEGLSFSGFLYRPEFLLTGMSYTFQKGGQYELTVRFFNKDGKSLAEASFLLIVEESDSGLSMDIVIGLVSGVIIGAGTVYLIMRKKRFPPVK